MKYKVKIRYHSGVEEFLQHDGKDRIFANSITAGIAGYNYYLSHHCDFELVEVDDE